MTRLITTSPAAPLLSERGVGPVTAAVLITAWSHPGRVRSEAAFASLAGVSPIPASSGNTTRHRLNRGGDRRLNQALHMAVITRMRDDPETRAYIERQLSRDKTTRDIRRTLKRYLARKLFRLLNALHQPSAHQNEDSHQPQGLWHGPSVPLSSPAQHIKRWKESWAREEYLM